MAAADMGIGGIGRVIGLRLARGGTAVVVHGRFDRATAGPGEIAAGRDQGTAPLWQRLRLRAGRSPRCGIGDHAALLVPGQRERL
jgi:hypothetical protein